MLPLKALRKSPSLPLFSFWWLPAILVFLGLQLHYSNFCLFCYMTVLPVSASKYPSLIKGTNHSIRAHSNPLWPYFSLITSTKKLIFKNSHIHWCWGLELDIIWGGYNLIYNKNFFKNSENKSVSLRHSKTLDLVLCESRLIKIS